MAKGSMKDIEGAVDSAIDDSVDDSGRAYSDQNTGGSSGDQPNVKRSYDSQALRDMKNRQGVFDPRYDDNPDIHLQRHNTLMGRDNDDDGPYDDNYGDDDTAPNKYTPPGNNVPLPPRRGQ